MSDLVAAAGITPTSWRPGRELTYEEWAQAGQMLQQIGRAWQWWVGDWLNYGEARYGERYAQAIDLTGLGYEAVANAAWVAGAVEPSTRVETLSWTHHRQVAHLSPEAQREWLEKAKAENLSTRELRAEIREDQAEPADGCYRTIVIDYAATRDHLDPARLASPDGADLYVWTNNEDLPQTLALIEKWGATYKRVIVPIEKIGLVTELVVYAHIGDPWPEREPPHSFAGGGRPDAFYQLVEWTSHGPRAGIYFEREGFDG